MKNNVTALVAFLTLACSGISFAQSSQQDHLHLASPLTKRQMLLERFGGSANLPKIQANSPLYRTIASIRGVNASGIADSLNRPVVLTGTVQSINFRPTGLEFSMADFSGGVHIFKNANVNPAYNVRQGDSIRVRGTVGQFRGLIQVAPDSISIVMVNRNVKTPVSTLQASEALEGRLIRISDLSVTSNSLWGGSGSYTAKALRQGNTTDTILIRIDSDAQITIPRPTGLFSVIGVSGQFTSSSSAPFLDGYQIQPRSNDDFGQSTVSGIVYAYVANISSNNVSMINTSDNTVFSTIPTGNAPGGIAVNPSGTRVYTTNQGSGSVSVISTILQSVIATIPVQGTPSNAVVSPDGTRLYVSSFNPDVITTINTATNTVVATYSTGSVFPQGLAVSPGGGLLYVSLFDPGKILILYTASSSLAGSIDVGGHPTHLAVNPDGGRLYVANYGSSTLNVISTSTRTVTANVPLPDVPGCVAVHPDGSKAYVSIFFSDKVSVLNTASNTLTTNITVGLTPDGISVTPDGSKVLVANVTPKTTSVISTATNQVTATIAVGDGPYSEGNLMPLYYQVCPPSVTFSPASIPNGTVGSVYSQTIVQTGFTNLATYSYSVSNMPPGLAISTNGLIFGTPTASGSYNLRFSITSGECVLTKTYPITIAPSSSQFAYIPCATSDYVSVVNTSTNSILTTIPVGDFPEGVAVNPDNSKVYISNQNSNNVSVISTASNSVVSTITVGNSPESIIVSPNGSRVYVCNYLGASVSVINAATNTVVATIPVTGNPSGIAITNDGGKVFVSHVFDDRITVINTATNTVSGTFSSSVRPTGMRVSPDGSKLYVCCIFSSLVRVYSTTTYAQLGTIPTANGPGNVALSPDGSKVYVASSLVDAITVANASDNSVIATIPMAVFPSGLSVTPDGSKLLVGRADFNTGGLTVISTATNSILTNVSIGVAAYSKGNMMPLRHCSTPAPVNTTSTGALSICSGTSTQLSASGIGSLSWYSAASGGTFLGAGGNFTTPVLTTNSTFYAQDSTCSQPPVRIPVVVTVNPVPVLTALTPMQGAISSNIVLSGSNLSAVASVKFNNLTSSFTVNSPTQITVVVPNSATNGMITVSTTAGCSDTISGFQVVNQTCATPTANPAGGNYGPPQTVALSCATPGASIYYTTNGILPTPGNAATKLYTSPLYINVANFTLKARAFKDGFVQSAPLSAVYSIANICGAVTINPSTGNYTGSQLITMSCPTPGATIYYAATGNVPVPGTSFTYVYSGPFYVSKTVSLRAFATKTDFAQGPTAVSNLTLTSLGNLGTVSFSPPTGTYANAQTVSLTTAEPGTTIYYTTSGNAPLPGTAFTQVYSGPISVFTSMTIKAFAYKAGYVNGPVGTATYTITNPAIVANPIFSPGPGAIAFPQAITLSCATVGAQIWYTTTGNTPDPASPISKLYSTPIVLNSATVLKAKAYLTGFQPSGVVTANYTGAGARMVVDESENDPGMAAFPNPTSGVLTVTGLSMVVASKITVWNTAGKMVMMESIPISSRDATLNLAELPSGLYQVEIQTAELRKQIRVVKE